MMHPDTGSLCSNQWLLFYRYLDERDYAALLETLSEEVVWERQGKQLQGKDAVLAALQQRSPTMRIHHLLCNVVVTHADAAHCRLSAYMLVLRHEAGVALPGPAPLRGIESVRGTHVEFARLGQAWRITRLYNDDISFLDQGVQQ